MVQESSVDAQRASAQTRSTGALAAQSVPKLHPDVHGSPLPDIPATRSPGALPTPSRASIATRLVTPLSSGPAAPNSTAPVDLLRQMRARLAFERASTRLYEVFLDKLDASPDTAPRSQRGALNRDTVVRFRNEEAAHFELLCESMESMGADPLAECAEAGADERPALDAAALSSEHVDTVQALDALLDAEQADEAGWQHLVSVAHDSGMDELAHRFEQAHSEEIGHVRQLRAWRAVMPTRQRRVA